MIFQANFGEAQTGVGYQFYDATGALLGVRATAGVVTLPEAGAYLVEVESPPAEAVGIYWDTTGGAEASEDFRAVLAAPEAPADADFGTVYLYTQNILGTKRAGITATLSLAGCPAKAGRAIEATRHTMTTNASGYASLSLLRTDAMLPVGRYYVLDCPALGIRAKRFTLAAATLDLSTLL